MLILGGHPAAKGSCVSSAVHLLDLHQPPPKGAVLPQLSFTLNSTANVVALATGSTALIFDGTSAMELSVV
eukprot:COSAG01_NODE_10078_length_2255_cov_1.365492_1_plen_71_part_00